MIIDDFKLWLKSNEERILQQGLRLVDVYKNITEKEIDHISLNYLSTEMAVDTGQSMSAYQCFLQAMQQEISSLSDNGCYDAEGRYYTLEEAPESMQQWIREYKILQYYMLFDGQER